MEKGKYFLNAPLDGEPESDIFIRVELEDGEYADIANLGCCELENPMQIAKTIVAALNEWDRTHPK
jgi:hypothetical protein